MTILNDAPNTSVRDLSAQTGIKTEDIISTLQYLNMIKHFKGQHIIMVTKDAVKAHLEASKKMRLCKPDCLSWAGAVGGKQQKGLK